MRSEQPQKTFKARVVSSWPMNMYSNEVNNQTLKYIVNQSVDVHSKRAGDGPFSHAFSGDFDRTKSLTVEDFCDPKIQERFRLRDRRFSVDRVHL